MHKVGIITTFRQPNWGSVLQAYALQRVVDRFGYQSEIIDYIYPNSYHIDRGIGPFSSKEPLKRRIARIFGLRPPSKSAIIDDFIRRNMRVSSVCPDMESLRKLPQYDIYISGSDQIWNPRTMLGDMSYFIDFASDNSKRISYASSFACRDIPNSCKDIYAKHLNKFQSISVRENCGKIIIKELINKEVPVVLDPTLLIEKSEWENLADKAINIGFPSKYILFYMLAYTYKPDAQMLNVLTEAQKRLNIPIIALSHLPAGFKGDVWKPSPHLKIGVEEVLSLFKNATMVVTSSYHGTSFSINFGVPFLSMTDSNTNADDRIPTLLGNLDLTDRIITNTANQLILESSYNIDTLQYNTKLNKLRESSLQWLKSNIIDS